jgi:hypothetical protein
MDVKDQVALEGRRSICDLDPEDVKERVIHAAEKLLEWVPKCSKFSSGDQRQTALREAIEDLKRI